jgi:hypothetical protein
MSSEILLNQSWIHLMKGMFQIVSLHKDVQAR